MDYSATDPLYDPTAAAHVSGATGVIIANNASAGDGPADATFDNFLATDGPLLAATFPLLSISTPASGIVNVSWPGVGNGASHVLTTNLQSSPSPDVADLDASYDRHHGGWRRKCLHGVPADRPAVLQAGSVKGANPDLRRERFALAPDG